MKQRIIMKIDKEFSVEDNTRVIRMIGSTSTADRVGDVMNLDPSAVDIKHYMANPVILENHDYHRPAVAKCVGIEFKDNKMIFDIEFADTDRGNEYLYLYKNGYQSASSIGFIGTEYEPAVNGKGEKTGGLFFKKWSLLELSLVTVPCNPEAITQAKEFISEELYNELLMAEDDTLCSDNVIEKENNAINEIDIQSILKALEIAKEIIEKNEDSTENTEAPKGEEENSEDTPEDDSDGDEEPKAMTEEEIKSIASEIIKSIIKGE